MSDASPALIERREFKFHIDDDMVNHVREAIRPYCVRDPFAGPDGTYTIDSLYFDTWDLRLYHATVYEVLDRFKARVRGYPQAPGAPVFFEVKRRYNDVISKTRGAVKGDWAPLIEDSRVGLERSIGRPAIERFLALTHTHHLTPEVIVRYEREAWMSTLDDYARVTFDKRIRGQAMENPTLQGDPTAWRAADDATMMKSNGSHTILELKFTNRVPTWMQGVVKRFELYRRAFSKYGCVIRSLRATPGLRMSASKRVA